MKKLKLFCLPYAGGTAVIFKEWEKRLPAGIEIKAIEYAGHGKRSNHPLYKDVNEAIEDVYRLISAEIMDGGSYAIFGHSMGAMLAYEVAQKIRQHNLPMPIHIFFSGRGVPHIQSKKEKIYHQMDDAAFQQEIANLGGTPKEFFDYPELMEYLLPILKNDFKISETAFRSTEIHPFDFPITIFMGKEEEEMEAENVHGWMLHTNQTCVVYYFNGGHFFINDELETIVGIIHKALTSQAKPYRVLRD
jgi:medium-chain acyl-[acyl-carrier-protein] hydrolase